MFICEALEEVPSTHTKVGEGSGLQRRLVRSSREQLRERLFCLEAKEVGFEVVRQGYFSDG